MTPRVEVCREGAYWTVYVDGMRCVDRESYALASRIAEGIISPGRHWPSEADEVATAIRRRHLACL